MRAIGGDTTSIERAGADSRYGSAEPCTAAEQVIRAVRSELATLPPDRDRVASLIDLADALLHRATLDDHIARRRRGAEAELRSAAGLVLPSVPAEPDEIMAAVTSIADELAERARDGDTTAAQALRRLARWAAGTDLPGVAEHVDRTDRAEPDQSTAYQPVTAASVSADQVLSLFNRDGGIGGRAIEVRDLRRLSGGFSKEMITATVVYEDHTVDIVIRKVAPGRAATTLGGEFAALSFAWAHGLPVPEPLLFEERALGSPAFATRRVTGRSLGDVWGALQPIDSQAVLAAATALARLHSLDAAELPAAPLPPMTTRSEVLAAIEERNGVVSSVAKDPTAPFVLLFALLFAWLRAHVPGDTERPVLLHGDYGLHNLLFDGDRLSAIVDWERAHLGDPTEDLAYIRPSVETLLPWERFLDAYRAAGGPPPAPARMRFYTVWHDVWRAVSCYRLRATFLNRPERLSDAMSGLLMCPRFLLRAAQNAFEL